MRRFSADDWPHVFQAAVTMWAAKAPAPFLEGEELTFDHALLQAMHLWCDQAEALDSNAGLLVPPPGSQGTDLLFRLRRRDGEIIFDVATPEELKAQMGALIDFPQRPDPQATP